jgi:hypothetical protein
MFARRWWLGIPGIFGNGRHLCKKLLVCSFLLPGALFCSREGQNAILPENKNNQSKNQSKNIRRGRAGVCSRVGEWIRGWNINTKARYSCWVYHDENKVLKLCYDSVWLMFDCRGYILLMLPLSFSQKEY